MPDELDLLKLKAKAKQKRAQALAAQAAPERPNALGAVGRGLNYFSDLTDQMTQGALFNLGDEVAAAGRYVGGQIGEALGTRDEPGASYGEALGQERARQEAFREENPVASTGANIFGGVGTAGQLMKGGATLMNAAQPTVRSMAGRGAAEGALYGAAYGAGEGQGGAEGRLSGAAQGGVLGAATGGAFGGLVGAMARPAVPTTKALKEAASAAYDRAARAGVVVSPRSYGQFADDVASAVKSAGIDKSIHPKATAALNRLQEAKGTSPSLKDMDLLRRVARSAASSNEADERRIARIIIDEIDDYVGRLGADDVVAGNAPEAVKALTEARGLWARTKKGEVLEELVARARNRASQFSGSGYENALRTEFRNLAQNAKRMRGFSPAEQEAIKKVAKGGPIENALRALGKFAPTGVVSATLSGGAGYGVGGPVGAVALPAAGFAARQGATAMTARNARIASELMRSGGQSFPSSLSPSREAIIRALLIGSSQQAGGATPLPVGTGQPVR